MPQHEKLAAQQQAPLRPAARGVRAGLLHARGAAGIERRLRNIRIQAAGLHAQRHRVQAANGARCRSRRRQPERRQRACHAGISSISSQQTSEHGVDESKVCASALSNRSRERTQISKLALNPVAIRHELRGVLAQRGDAVSHGSRVSADQRWQRLIQLAHAPQAPQRRQAQRAVLGVQAAQRVLRRVGVRRPRRAKQRKPGVAVGAAAGKRQRAAAHAHVPHQQQHVVKLPEHSLRRAVNGRHDIAAVIGQLTQKRHHVRLVAAVEARRRLCNAAHASGKKSRCTASAEAYRQQRGARASPAARWRR